MRFVFVILAALAVACDPPTTVQPAMGFPQPPAGGGGGTGDITSVGVSAPISGGGTSGDVTISLSSTGCIAGEAWIYDGANFACTTVFDGDITAVTASSPLAVATGTGPIPALSMSTTGCIAGEAWIYDGANFACTTVFDGDITGVTAGRGLTGTATTGTATIATAHPNAGARCYDEFLGAPPGSNSGPCVLSAVASSGTVTGAGVIDATHPGGVLLTTVTSAAARATLLSNGSSFDSVVFGTGANNSLEWMVQLSNLSDVTDTYSLRIGYIDSVNADAADGAYFEYVSGTSANWACKLSAASSRTSLDSTVAVAATTWTKLRVEVDAASAARFYINGTQVCGAIALTNLPTAGTQIGLQFLRSVGTTSRTVTADYVDAITTFTGAGR